MIGWNILGRKQRRMAEYLKTCCGSDRKSWNKRRCVPFELLSIFFCFVFHLSWETEYIWVKSHCPVPNVPSKHSKQPQGLGSSLLLPGKMVRSTLFYKVLFPLLLTPRVSIKNLTTSIERTIAQIWFSRNKWESVKNVIISEAILVVCYV